MHAGTRANPAPEAANSTSASTLTPEVTPSQSRKLPERILVAVHEACDLGDLDVAAKLLSTVETLIQTNGNKLNPELRRTMKSMIAAHYRLWQLRHDGYVATEPRISAHEFHEGIVQDTRSDDWLLGG